MNIENMGRKIILGLLQLVSFFLVLGLFGNKTFAQTVANNSGADKSNLVIHGNARDGSADRIMNNHLPVSQKSITAKKARHIAKAHKVSGSKKANTKSKTGKKKIKLGKKASSHHHLGIHHH